MPAVLRTVAIALLALLAAAGGPLEQRIYRAFLDGDYARAAALVEEHLTAYPNDPVMLYNAACAHSLLGRRDRAVTYLIRAVESGLTDLDLMTRDPDLAAIRDHPGYEALLQRLRPAGARPRTRDAMARWRELYGDGQYRYERDEQRHIGYATALDPVAFSEMRSMLERQADQLTETLFDVERDAYVLIAVPTPDDGRRLFASDNTGGIYEHDKRRLIARDIGGSLRHEFVHAFHYEHMEALGQRHPLWIQEGLATLYETYVVEPGGALAFLPNERHNVVRGLALDGGLPRWSEMFRLSDEAFMADAPRLYPMVRSIFEFVADSELLKCWYRALIESFERDPTGGRAFELCFDQPLREIERSWRRWVIGRPNVDMNITLGDAALGIESRRHSINDGVLITRVLPGSTAELSGLRIGDVIVSVDGVPTRSLAELQGIIGARKVGEAVTLRARRDREYFTVEMTLRPLRPAIW